VVRIEHELVPCDRAAGFQLLRSLRFPFQPNFSIDQAKANGKPAHENLQSVSAAVAGAIKKGASAPRPLRKPLPRGTQEQRMADAPLAGSDRPALSLVFEGPKAQGGSFCGDRTDFRKCRIVVVAVRRPRSFSFLSIDQKVGFPALEAEPPHSNQRGKGVQDRGRPRIKCSSTGG
jgi:hypothetical protein